MRLQKSRKLNENYLFEEKQKLLKSEEFGKMHSNLWLCFIVLFSLISGYYTQNMHFVDDNDNDDDDSATIEPTNPGIKDTDGYCIFEDK